MSNLWDFVKRIFNQNNSEEETTSELDNYDWTIRVIGPRYSGKTVFLAALARWPNANSNSPIQSVIAINRNGEKLIEKAKNLLEQGEQLQATGAKGTDLNVVEEYSINIKLKDQFTWRNSHNRNTQGIIDLNVVCKDYPGEFFQDIIFQYKSQLLKDYLEDCLQAKGILLLIDGTGYRQDRQFANGLERFLAELGQAKKTQNLSQPRIALVVTKCEQPELWNNRYQPQEIVGARFKRVRKKLEDWDVSEPGNVEYFAASAFGMVGKRFPKPNMKILERKREGITASVLEYPDFWTPFGLVAPLYWLYTGKRHQMLDKE